MANYNFDFTIVDVLPLAGISDCATSHKEARATCPFCGAKRGFTVNTVKNLYKCFKCDEGGGTLDLVRKTNGLSDNKQALALIKKELFGIEPYKEYTPEEKRAYAQKKKELEQKRLEAQKREIPQSPLASVHMRDITNHVIVYQSNLSDRHKKDLMERGFTAEVIKENEYFTTPVAPMEIAHYILKEGLCAAGVAGFYKEGDSWTCNCNKQGFYIPIKTPEGWIQGFQIRVDNELLSEGKGKYIWFSSKDKPYGCSSGSPVHYAIKHDYFGYQKELNGDEMWLTEGALKADLAHAISGKPFIAVAGVNALSSLESEFKMLKERGVKRVVNAYDMDSDKNLNVKKALDKTKEIAKACGLDFVRVTWQTGDKGIDDYLVNLKKSKSQKS